MTVPVPEQPRLRVLLLAASPVDQARLRLGNEVRAIEKRIRSSRYGDQIKVISEWAVRRSDLQEALLRHQPHIVHFSGHAKAEGILLEDADGHARLAPAEALARVFQILKDSIRLVVFNACYSADQAGAVTEYIDFAIGMHEAIGSDTASTFAANFYMGLGYGRSLRDAFEIGKNDLALHELPEADQPVLLQRKGADAASAFLVALPASQQVSTASEPDDGPDPLSIPWRHKLPRNGSLYNLLSWRYRLAGQLIGRDAELEALMAWAEGDEGEEPGPRLHWISGPGGVGKTRLAAELCERLREKGWKAGFVEPDPEPDGAAKNMVPRSRRGVCIVVDYPEERRERALQWVRAAARVHGREAPVRLLMLSRRDLEEWKEHLQRERAWELCDEMVIPALAQLGPDDCVVLFRDVAQRYAEAYSRQLPELDDAAIVAWCKVEPQTHGRPLFVMAAAIHAVLEPGKAISLRGCEIVRALVEREAAQLDRLGERLGLGPRTAATLCGLAAVTAGLDDQAIRRLADPALALGLPAADEAVECVAGLPSWRQRALHGPTPDLVAAGLLHSCLKRQQDTHRAAEWLWATMALAVECDVLDDVIDRFERLCFDADSVLGSDSFRLGAMFARAIGGEFERARAFETVTYVERLAPGLTSLAVSVARRLVTDLREKAQDNPGRFLPSLAIGLNNLSARLADEGRPAEALSAVQEAAEVYRRLRPSNHRQFLPGLAMILNNLSVRLADEGRSAEALKVIEEAAEVYRRLTQENRREFLPNLAKALNNLSVRLADEGRPAEALSAVQEGVGVCRRLVAYDNSGQFLPDLAVSLNNLSLRLADPDPSAAALDAIQEAVDIRRWLARDNPGRFLPDLATSLNNLSLRLADAGRGPDEVLTAIEEAVDIRRRLARYNPGRFLPDLAMSLHNQSLLLSYAGRSSEGVAAAQEAISYYRRLAEEIPQRFGLYLVKALNNLGEIHDENQKPDEAEQARTEANNIERQLML